MNRNIATLLICFLSLKLFSQGLEDIIVEKYYVSDINDAIPNDGGTLNAGSITYRIYVDLLPGWILQSVYADPVRGHDIRFETTTTFFNNEDRGATNPKAISSTFLKNNTVMLDSWITLNSASSTNVGVLKSEDTNGAILNADGLLQNTDSRAGIPIKTRDGMIPGTTPSISTIGLDQALSVFDNVTAGPVFSVSDGAWFNAPGVSGPTSENRILIAQITTDGVFSFRFNIQIRRESDFKVEQYVYSNPFGQEVLCEKCSSLGVPTGLIKMQKTGEGSGNAPRIKLYPNPAKTNLNIEYATEANCMLCSIVIMDIIGKPLLQFEEEPVSGKVIKNVDISKLPGGIYLINIKSDKRQASAKIFVSNQ